MSTVAEAGKVLARFGAVLGAVSGFVDAVAAWKAAGRAGAVGDGTASSRYYWAAGAFTVSAFASGVAIYTGSTAILSTSWVLGPVGWVILAGISGYVLWKLAEGAESSPLERWAYYCLFGKAKNNIWPDAATAVAALNAAVLGVDAFVKFGSSVRVEQYTGMAAAMGGVDAGLAYVPQLEYQIVLPRYDALRAGYSWRLVVKRYSGEQVLVSGRHQFASSESGAGSGTPKRLDYDAKTVTPSMEERTITATDGTKTNFLIVTGKIELMLGHDIEEATINIGYLPNIQDADMVARLEIIEIK